MQGEKSHMTNFSTTVNFVKVTVSGLLEHAL